MSTKEELLDDAVKMIADGYDNVYIELQFAEQGIDKATIQEVIKQVKALRKTDRRRQGVKFMIGGLATVAVGISFTLISHNSDSPVGYVLYGLIVAGFMSFAKGLFDLF